MSISTWIHGDTVCLYPQGDMETLHVHFHMETWIHTWRHEDTLSISTWRHGDNCMSLST